MFKLAGVMEGRIKKQQIGSLFFMKPIILRAISDYCEGNIFWRHLKKIIFNKATETALGLFFFSEVLRERPCKVTPILLLLEKELVKQFAVLKFSLILKIDCWFSKSEHIITVSIKVSASLVRFPHLRCTQQFMVRSRRLDNIKGFLQRDGRIRSLQKSKNRQKFKFICQRLCHILLPTLSVPWPKNALFLLLDI